MDRLNFCTSVDTSSSGFHQSHSMKTLMLGSCFAEHIGEHLFENKFPVLVNPFGVLYNPLSIFQAIQLLLEPFPSIMPNGLFFDDNLWHHWMFSSKFSSPNRDECLRLINTSLQKAQAFFQQADVLTITFGTTHCYLLKDGTCATNCHKQPAKTFTEHVLSLDEIKAYRLFLEHLVHQNPKLQIIFTVSPYRYVKYGLHQNQLSKSTLLLAIEYFRQALPDNTHYFPAYEILNDELRDYRFYADDLQHPSPLAIEYIWNIFLNDWTAPASLAFVHEWQPILRSLSHRPLTSDSCSYRQFLINLKAKVEALQKKYSNLSFEEELLKINDNILNIL